MKLKVLYSKSIIVAFLLLVVSAPAKASDIGKIELTDGSIITGEIVSLSDGIYTVRSASLGTVRIEASKIRVIRLRGASSGDTKSRVKALEDEMLGNDEIMEAIRALQDDPDLQKILQDPVIMKAVQTGDVLTLMNDPRIRKLMDKQSIRDISGKLNH